MNGQCPAGQSGYFSHPTYCNRYVECSNGDPTYVHMCPQGKSWTSKRIGFGYCDASDLVQCQPSQDFPDNLPIGIVNMSTIQPAGVVTGQSTSSPEAISSSSSASTSFFHLPVEIVNMSTIQPAGVVTGQSTSSPGAISSSSSASTSFFHCPDVLVGNRTDLNGFYGDPSQCNEFWLCLNGVPFLFSCPVWMQWSDHLGYCDWSYIALCHRYRSNTSNNNYNNTVHNSSSDGATVLSKHAAIRMLALVIINSFFMLIDV